MRLNSRYKYFKKNSVRRKYEVVPITLIIALIFLSNGFMFNLKAQTIKLGIIDAQKYELNDDIFCGIKNILKDKQMVFELSNIPSDFIYSILNNNSEWQLSGIGGAPTLPVRTYKLLLPPKVDPLSVKLEIIKSTSINLEGARYFPPAPSPVALTEDGIILSSEDLSYTFNQDLYWPIEFIDSIHIQQIRSATILEFSFYPYQYNPIKKAVIEHHDVSIAISWEEYSNAKNKIDPLTTKFLLNLGNDIDNLAEILPKYEVEISELSEKTLNANPLTSDTPDTTYLIVTTNTIESNSDKLDDFVRYKQALGFNVMIITEDEYGSTSGEQRVLNIRSWLQSHYITDNIEYVLLIGNPDPDEPGSPDSYGDLPMLFCYPVSVVDTTATDYIYADLTGNWDSDGDGYYGEHGQDTGVDFGAEVYVGRIPVYSSDYTSLDNILQNIIDHHINAGAEKNNALVPMAISNYANEDESGYDRSDGLNCPEDFYNNVLNPASINDTVMYERSGINPVPISAFHYDMALTKANFISEFNKGQGTVFWWGHGSSTGVYRKYWSFDDGDSIPEYDEMTWSTFLESSDMSSLETDQPAFIYQSSCTNGKPEDSDNLGYSLLKRGAAVSTISAAEISWYLIGTWGYNQYWDQYADNTGIGYYYFDNLLKDNMTSGTALYTAKASGGNGLYPGSWMNKMDFNIYGDPQINYWGSDQPNSPINPTPSDDATVGTSPTLSVDVSDPDGDNLTVAFYNASDNSLIGTDLDVVSGGTASVEWSGLSGGSEYEWYVIVGDGQVIRQSSTWSFTTNTAPNSPINPTPSDEATNIPLNATLSVDVSDPDGDDLTVTFYNASDNSIIGTDTILGGSGTASIGWSGLSGGSEYEWYVIANDSLTSTQSSTWSFTTNTAPNSPSGIPGYNVLIIIGMIAIGMILFLSKKRVRSLF